MDSVEGERDGQALIPGYVDQMTPPPKKTLHAIPFLNPAEGSVP